MTRIADLFPKLRTLKNKLDQCLISPVSEDASKSKMVNVPKDCWNLWTTGPLPYLLIIVKATHLQKFSLSDIQNLKIVC